MIDGAPVVLIATVSRYDGRSLELTLKRMGWDLVRVASASEAREQIAGPARPAVLVIDAGLLQMEQDAQWRTLRTGHPALGTVVRSLVPRSGKRGPLARWDGRALAVHPDDFDGLCRAIRSLAAPDLPSD